MEDKLKLENMFTFDIIVYPEDNSKYKFDARTTSYSISGLIFADSLEEATENLYKHIGVENGKTICLPNISHFVEQHNVDNNNNKLFCTGFASR